MIYNEDPREDVDVGVVECVLKSMLMTWCSRGVGNGRATNTALGGARYRIISSQDLSAADLDDRWRHRRDRAII